VTCDVCRVACDVWRVACGVWRVTCDVWRVACGVWRVTCNVQLWTRRLDSLLKLTWDVAALGVGGKFHVVLAVRSE